MGQWSDFLKSVGDNITFLAVVCCITVLLIGGTRGLELVIKRRQGEIQEHFSVKKMAAVGMMAAIAMILMLFEFPLPFLAPPFYELDFSEVPVLICSFLYGPVAGVLVELVKVILRVLIKGTSTAFVGDFANFAVGCSMVIPAAFWYQKKKNRKNAVIAMGIGTVIMTVFGTLFNGVYLLPKFAQLYGMPLDQILAMGTAVNGGIHDIVTFVIIAVAPINFIKGGIVTILVTLIYKPITRGFQRAF